MSILANLPVIGPLFSSNKDQLLKDYDYIVIGGGSAGCVVAARLSEDKNVNVLLLEAGGDGNTFAVRTPGAYFDLQMTEVDWQVKTRPQKAMGGRIGLCLGGCSSVNAMLYVRGGRGDYDGWAAAGCDGWGYEDVLSYFKKSEGCHIPSLCQREHHSADGPLNIQYASGGDPNPLTKDFIAAFRQVTGITNDDYNSGDGYGASVSFQTVHNGLRCDTARAFLFNGEKPAIRRPNLTVITSAHVTRIAVENGKTTGVYFKCSPHGTSKEAFMTLPETFIPVTEQVILSAGAVHTPAILMYSGIGPQDHLKKVGIKVTKHLPGVGRNLQDHLFVGLAFKEYQGVAYTSRLLDTVRYFGKYFLHSTGPVAGSPVEALAFMDSAVNTSAQNGRKRPDLQFHILPARITKQTHYARTNTKPLQPELSHDHGLTVFPTLLLPESTGYIELNSSHPLDDIRVEPNYLSAEYDIKVLMDGIFKCREIAKSQALEPYKLEEIVDTTIPFPPDTPAYVREYVKRQAITVYHPVGTAKMGRADDPMAVVDSRCRVFGIEGLRVADASVMPRIVAANTNAACIMIGEKVADMIKKDRQK
ncbi:hypothetical protein SpCBS45565_g04495 [Spizellomyces sp. 'palustris']|nr:hypothetical protein SpCBS45565_g04495 [Spizellomyces sp. 'palustris']